MLVSMAGVFDRLRMCDVLFFVWPDGSALRSVNTTFDASQREYFKKVTETKREYISDVTISSSSGKPSIMICEPVLDGERFIGMLGATYNLERLDSVVKRVKFGDTGYGFIVDENGLVISNPKYPDTIGKLNLSEEKVNPDAKLKFPTLDANLRNLFKETASTWDKESYGEFSFEGTEFIGAFSPITFTEGQRWTIVVSAPATEIDRNITVLFKTMISISAAFVLLALIFVVIISRRVAKPIVTIRDECLVLASGDLRSHSLNVHSEDEIGELADGFVRMKENLVGLISKVKSQAENLAASSEELTASAHSCETSAGDANAAMGKIREGAATRAALTKSIGAGAREITAITRDVLAVTLKVSGIAANASKEARSGQTAAERAMEQMKEISRGASAVQSAITELDAGSREISEIVSLISSVAQQTNLLALNAAIEAARAGEHGRGFAVVAEEVRNLAESSNNAAQQIATLIAKNQSNMEKAVTATQASEEGLNAGIEVVNTTGDLFSRIATEVISLSDQIAGVSGSIEKISSGNERLVTSIDEIEQISRVNIDEVARVSDSSSRQVDSIQAIAMASQELAKMAEDLNGAAANFKV
jgi:methyl-accepting chemotaxis protein